LALKIVKSKVSGTFSRTFGFAAQLHFKIKLPKADRIMGTVFAFKMSEINIEISINEIGLPVLG